MNELDLDRIESELDLKLPHKYRELMLHYPFPPDSMTAEYGLCDDADFLIEQNRAWDLFQLFGDRAGPGPPHGTFFQIGSDGSEETYYINVTNDNSPVFKYDLECHAITIQAANLTEYVAQRWAGEEEIRLDEERMSQKKWWQF